MSSIVEWRRILALGWPIAFLACLALLGAPSGASAQSCFANITGDTIPPTPTPTFVGDVVRERIVLNNDSSSSTPMTIDNYRHKLECFDTGLPILLELCEDPAGGPAKDFLAFVQTDCTDAGGGAVSFDCSG